MSDQITMDEKQAQEFQNLYNQMLDLRVKVHLQNLVNKKPIAGRKIRVGFLVQAPELWGNESDVYEEMKKREEFEPLLLVIPAYDHKDAALVWDYDTNFFIKNYPEAIWIYDEKMQVIDIESLDLDYVFYPRPYDNFIPTEVRSETLVKIAKTCYIPYGPASAENFHSLETDPVFFRNIYLLFADCEYMKDLLIRARKAFYEGGLQKITCLGYPALEPFFSIERNDNINTILWTPRWSYDPELGGSHFIEYQDIVFKIRDMYPDKHIIFRPHPGLFDEMLKTGRMTEEEKIRYIDMMEENNIVYDVGTPFEDSISKADLMITDFSSIIMEWFITGKPIIYCPGSMRLVDYFVEIEKLSYIANDESEIISHVSKIVDGDDSLLNDRLALIETAKKLHIGSAIRITDAIYEDYYSNA